MPYFLRRGYGFPGRKDGKLKIFNLEICAMYKVSGLWKEHGYINEVFIIWI